jgi:hypothetical protein
MATLNFTYFLNQTTFIKNNRGTSLIGAVFCLMTVRISNYETSSTREANNKLCNTLLRMLLVCISSYLKSVLRYKFLSLDAYHPDTLHLRE